jgi:hypothetical protein
VLALAADHVITDADFRQWIASCGSYSQFRYADAVPTGARADLVVASSERTRVDGGRRQAKKTFEPSLDHRVDHRSRCIYYEFARHNLAQDLTKQPRRSVTEPAVAGARYSDMDSDRVRSQDNSVQHADIRVRQGNLVDGYWSPRIATYRPSGAKFPLRHNSSQASRHLE